MSESIAKHSLFHSSHLGLATVNEERGAEHCDLIDSGDRDVKLETVLANGQNMAKQVFRKYDPTTDLRAAYADWLLSWEWQWFVTLTFPDCVHPESARKKFGCWIDWINRKLFGKKYWKRNVGVYWALATEYQDRGVLHYHALLAAPEDLNFKLSRRDARNRWYEMVGLAVVDPIDANMGAVTSYISKYVVKGGDIELSETLERYRRQLTFGANPAKG